MWFPLLNLAHSGGYSSTLLNMNNESPKPKWSGHLSNTTCRSTSALSGRFSRSRPSSRASSASGRISTSFVPHRPDSAFCQTPDRESTGEITVDLLSSITVALHHSSSWIKSTMNFPFRVWLTSISRLYPRRISSGIHVAATFNHWELTGVEGAQSE